MLRTIIREVDLSVEEFNNLCEKNLTTHFAKQTLICDVFY